MQELECVVLRLERLEIAHKRWKLLSTLAGLVLLAALGCSVARPAEQTVEAQRFVLRGPDGEQLGLWGVDQAGHPHILMREDEASAILTLAGPALNFRGEDGKRGAFLGVDTRGESRLELRSERMIDGARLVTKPDGATGLYLLDETGRERTAMEYVRGSALFNARDGEGRVRSHYGLDAEDNPNLVLFDVAGQPRIGMLVHTEDQERPLFLTQDAQGNILSEISTDRDGFPLLKLSRKDGKEIFRAP
jgi:hypothetical protein